jgi:NADP-dependent 3-hydroxy acid dehydrogenase YdfG
VIGTSSGFGARFVVQLLERGHRVIATARTLSSIEGKFPVSDNLRLLRLDIRDDTSQIADVMEQAISFWGHVDVLLNNAGVGVLGLIEDAGYLSSFDLLLLISVDFFL